MALLFGQVLGALLLRSIPSGALAHRMRYVGRLRKRCLVSVCASLLTLSFLTGPAESSRVRARAFPLRLSASAPGSGFNRHPPPPNNSFKPTPHRGVNSVLYATLARCRRPAVGRLNSGVRHQTMHWLNVRYSPGFQEDLTSWVMSIKPDGRIVQNADICLFSPPEKRKDTYHSRLNSAQMADLTRCISVLPFDEIATAANQFVIDDAEQVTITYFGNREASAFTAPLEWWSYRRSSGDLLSPAILSAIDLWGKLLPLSQYRGRATGA